MAFDVTAINYAWVNENNQNLILKALIGAQTANYVTVYPGVKYKENLKYLSTNAATQAGGCGYTASGTTTIIDKDLVVVSMKWTETLCPDDLEKTALQLSMKAGKNEAIPFFSQAYVEYKTKVIQRALETMYWSSTASSSVKCEGLIYTLDNDSDVHDVSLKLDGTATGYTFANWQTGIYAMVNHLDAEVKEKDDLTLFVNYTIFSLIQQAMVTANFNYRTDNTGSNLTPFVFPGTSVKVVPIKALGNYGVLTSASNLIWVTDLVSEEDKMQLWYSQDNQEVRFVANGKLGSSYYFGDYIVLAQ